MNLSNFSLSDLRNLQNQVSKQLEVTAQQDIAKAREEIQAIARSVGISLEELVKGAVDKKSQTVAVQFHNPGNPEERWTGRGRQPRWVKECLDAGKTLDALRV